MTDSYTNLPIVTLSNWGSPFAYNSTFISSLAPWVLSRYGSYSLWCRRRSVCYWRHGRDRRIISQNCIVRGHGRLSSGVFWRQSKELSRDSDVSLSRDLIPGRFCRLVTESLILVTFSGFFDGHVRQAIEYPTTLVSHCNWISFGMISRLRDTGQKTLFWFLSSMASPGVDSASNINEYQEYFLGVKAAGT